MHKHEHKLPNKTSSIDLKRHDIFTNFWKAVMNVPFVKTLLNVYYLILGIYYNLKTDAFDIHIY